MTNIFRKHFHDQIARQAADAAVEQSTVADGLFARADGLGGIIRPDAASSDAAIMLMRLTHDRARLKGIQSQEAKIAAKREMLPEYENWLDGLILGADALPEGQPNDVLCYAMVWHIDTGNIARALELAAVILGRKVAFPPHFKRTGGCLIAEEIAESAFEAMRDKEDFDIDLIIETQILVEAEDMPDEVRAKLFKAEAMLLEKRLNARLEAAGDGGVDGPAALVPALLNQATTAAQRALKLHEACGVKTLITKLERTARKLEADKVAATPPPLEAAN